MALNLNDPNGLVNFHNLAQEVEKIAPDDKSVPIVFVPGFTGWGAPLFGAINYFGGEIDIATLLANRGYTVIVASIAPMSTNWERACELYRQLAFGQCDSHHLDTLTWLQNDGIVNTASMPGPRGSIRNVGSLPDVDFSIPGKQGICWHLGVKTIPWTMPMRLECSLNGIRRGPRFLAANDLD